MPLPFFLWAGAAVAAGLGLGAYSHSEAERKNRIARKSIRGAKERFEEAQGELETQRNKTMKEAEEYGEFLLHIRTTTFAKSFELMEAIGKKTSTKDVNLQFGKEIFNLFDLSNQIRNSFREAKNIQANLSSAAGGAIQGAAAGLVISKGALGLATLFGTASTGTAISSLSGAAASKATLAWLGGGSLASGGLGMLGGQILLGGIIIAPVVLFSGLSALSDAEDNLTEAREFRNEVENAVEKMKTMKGFLEEVSKRIQELKSIAIDLNLRANSLLPKVDPEKVVFYMRRKKENEFWTPSTEYEKETANSFLTFQKTALLVKTLSELMKVPILKGEKGELNEEGYNKFQAKYRQVFYEI